MKLPVARMTVAWLAATAAIPAHAQDVSNEQVEQSFLGIDLGGVGDFLEGAACAVGGRVLGDIVNVVGCNGDDDDENNDGGNSAEPESATIPDGELKPSITVNMIKLTGSGDNVVAEAGAPETVYETGSGFAMILQNTAPGYLEIWSLDDEASYVEGALLAEAGALVLPKTVEGLYRFNENSPEDYVRFRFYPCQPSSQQGFEVEENQQAAAATDRAAAAIARLSDRLPTCSFITSQIKTAIAAKEPQDQLFRTALPQEASFDRDKGAYLIESDRVRPMTSFIQMKRR